MDVVRRKTMNPIENKLNVYVFQKLGLREQRMAW